MPLDREVGPSPTGIVLDGDPVPLPQKGTHPPNFRPMYIVASTAGWIKIPLGTEVDLSLGHIVLDEDPAPPRPAKGAQPPPSFRPMSVVATVAHLSYC